MEKAMRNVILDVHPEVSQSPAVLAALKSEKIRLLGITVTWGRLSMETAAQQALMLCELAGKQAAVYSGCPGPIARKLYRRRDDPVVAAAPGDLPLPQPKAGAAREHAVAFLVHTCRTAVDKCTLVAQGPLTNIAMALRIAPDIAARIREILLVDRLHVAYAPENLRQDPEAAEIVLRSGIPLRIVPLHVTPEGAPDGTIRRFPEDLPSCALENAVGILALETESLLRASRKLHIQVCLDHGTGAGAILTDPFCKEKTNIEWVTDIDTQRCCTLAAALNRG